MFQQLLLPVDLSDTQHAAKAIQAAAELALSHQARLNVITVLPGFGSPVVANYFPKQDLKKVLDEIYARLEKLVEPYIPDELEVKLRAIEGTPHKEILKEAKRIKADLIVIPSHNPKAVERFFLGSVAARVVERAKVSVMVIRQ